MYDPYKHDAETAREEYEESLLEDDYDCLCCRPDPWEDYEEEYVQWYEEWLFQVS